MKISIALATYNGEKYLKEQLDSYIKQKRQPDEIVVCDDVSSDNTVAILEEFKKIVPFTVLIIKNDINLGYIKNFEKALSLCTGDIVFFSDQDDIWLENKIEKIEKIFESNTNISLIVHDAELVDTNLKSTGLTKLKQLLSGGYKEKDFATGTLSALRKNIIDIVLPFPPNISGGHDGWVHSIASLLNQRLVVNDVLQKLRRHEDNTSEWVVNSLKKINKLDTWKSQASTVVATSYKDRLYYNNSLRLRFEKVEANIIDENHKINYKNIYETLSLEYFSLSKRETLLSKNFIIRKWMAILMLVNGDYRYFNGIKSFLRDFIR